MVVIDEAYFEFSGVTVIPWIRRHANLIVTRTFSKDRRTRWPAPRLHFRQSRSRRQHAQGAIALSGECRRAGRCRSRHARPRLHRAHRSRSAKQAASNSSAASRASASAISRAAAISSWFISATRAKKIVAALDRKGILLRDRSSDFSGDGYVRITVGTPAQTRRLLRELKAIL